MVKIVKTRLCLEILVIKKKKKKKKKKKHNLIMMQMKKRKGNKDLIEELYPKKDYLQNKQIQFLYPILIILLSN